MAQGRASSAAATEVLEAIADDLLMRDPRTKDRLVGMIREAAASLQLLSDGRLEPGQLATTLAVATRLREVAGLLRTRG